MIHLFEKKGAIVFFPKDWANDIVKWISGIHSPTGTIKVQNTLTPDEKKSAAIDVNLPELVKELQRHFVGRNEKPAENVASTEEKKPAETATTADSNLYPFKTEKYSGQFIIYLPDESFIVDNSPVSITSGLTACSGKGANWYYLPTPSESTGKRWYLRIAVANNATTGSISTANTDNDTIVKFIAIAAIADDREETIQYIVGTVIYNQGGEASTTPTVDETGPLTVQPADLSIRKTWFVDQSSGNKIEEFWLCTNGFSPYGQTSYSLNKFLTQSGFSDEANKNSSTGYIYSGDVLIRAFANRPSGRPAKSDLKPTNTFKYLQGQDTITNMLPWIYCGSKTEYPSGTFDIYALVIVSVERNLETAYEIHSETKSYYHYSTQAWVSRSYSWRTRTEVVSDRYWTMCFIILSNSPISSGDITLNDTSYDYEGQAVSGGTRYARSEITFDSKYTLFSGKLASIVDMEVTQYNTYLESAVDTSQITFLVTFADWDGTQLKIMAVSYNGTAVPPSDPTRAGYDFVGWDRALDKIHSNITITAVYAEYHTVTFLNADETVLKTEQVSDGHDATPPSNVSFPHSGDYTFSGWDGAYTNITHDKTLMAQFTYSGE